MAYTTIKKPSDYFNTKLYTGNGSTNAITGVGFQPDFTWIKDRTNAYGHDLYDVIRGVTNRIQSNDTGAESSASGLTSFDSDGFTLGSYIGDNTNTANYASWNWLASNTTASNTDGSITSTVSANTTSGFSIVKYTGASNASGETIGHGLGAVPKMIIVKETSLSGNNWVIYNSNLGAGKYIALNLTIAEQSSSIMWNNTIPTSSVFSVANDSQNNGTGSTFIAYCFAEVKGFSKFGSYVSNNNADGTFVYTGFKPAFLLLKNITTANTGWEIYDNKRTPNNVANLFLRANTSDADVSSDRLDILSNGFKLRQVGDTNSNSDVIIYMAFAEEPLVGDNPATAR